MMTTDPELMPTMGESRGFRRRTSIQPEPPPPLSWSELEFNEREALLRHPAVLDTLIESGRLVP
jgi:hypothetical protein